MKLFKLIYCRECQGYVAVQWLEYNHCNVSIDHNLNSSVARNLIGGGVYVLTSHCNFKTSHTLTKRLLILGVYIPIYPLRYADEFKQFLLKLRKCGTNNMNQTCSQNSVSWAQNIPKMRLWTPPGKQRSSRPPSWVYGEKGNWGRKGGEGRGRGREGTGERKGKGRGRGRSLTP